MSDESFESEHRDQRDKRSSTGGTPSYSLHTTTQMQMQIKQKQKQYVSRRGKKQDYTYTDYTPAPFTTDVQAGAGRLEDFLSLFSPSQDLRFGVFHHHQQAPILHFGHLQSPIQLWSLYVPIVYMPAAAISRCKIIVEVEHFLVLLPTGNS